LNNVESPAYYLQHFLTLISRLRGGDSRYLPLLLAKVSETLPGMTAPMHQMPMTMIKQGYAGASDGTPTPEMPSSRGSLDSIVAQMQPSLGPEPQPPNRELMFDTYSPSIHSSHTPLTPLDGPNGFPGMPAMTRSVTSGVPYNGHRG
jgi:hypothetical protein